MVYVDKLEVAKTFQIPVSTVDLLRRQGKVPSFKVGKHWRYDIKEVEKAFKEHNGD